MMGVREAVEQAIFVAVGAASLTRDRAEAIVADLVKRGQMTDEEGRVTVEGLMSRVTGDGDMQGLLGKIEGGVQGAMRELGVVHRDDLADVDQRLGELEHRIRLLEEASGAVPGTSGGDDPLS